MAKEELEVSLPRVKKDKIHFKDRNRSIDHSTVDTIKIKKKIIVSNMTNSNYINYN